VRFVALLLLCGCGSSPYLLNLDLGVNGDAAADMAGLPVGAHPDTCKPPLVLVGIQNFTSGATAGGRVLALSLPSGTPCSTYSAGGKLTPNVEAVAWLPSGGVAAATDEGLFVMNADDTVKFAIAPPTSGLLPVDVFPMTMGATEFAVVGWSSSRTIERLDAYNGGFSLHTWDSTTTGISGAFPLVGATLSPLDPSHFLGLEQTGTSTDAAIDLDPFNAMAFDYKAYPFTGTLATIASINQPPLRRTVWVDSDANGVVYFNDGSGMSGLGGPITACATSVCPQMLHAVPDPTEPHTFLVLCGASGSLHRTVRRVSSTGSSCDLIFDGAEAGSQTRLSKLAVAQ
jgi:hypothetical protein